MLGITWKITPEIRKLDSEVSSLNLVFSRYHPRPELRIINQKHGFLKSAVYSARIENIPARIDDPRITHKLEIQNLLSGYRYIYSSAVPRKISPGLIRKFHRQVLKSLSPDAGSLRGEPWAIFNQAGVAVYLAPAHFKLPELFAEYADFSNSLKESPPVSAAISQFVFEKMHPFADGNGRVGRLISAFILQKFGFGFVSQTEEYIDNHKDQYYRALEPNSDCTDFICFFLTAIKETSQLSLENLSSSSRKPSPEEGLLPRRQEIIAIIREHPGSTFDFIHRRFHLINPKTLHNDLQILQKQEFIQKLGVSRGVVYQIIKK